MQNDTLFTIFMSQLEDTHRLSEHCSEFIQRVTGLYSLQLTKNGTIPLHMLNDVIEDIEAEVIEMYRKKTYGFLTLEEYRKHHFSKTA